MKTSRCTDPYARELVEHLERLELRDTMFEHIDDPIASAPLLADGFGYELSIERADSPGADTDRDRAPTLQGATNGTPAAHGLGFAS